MKSENTVRIRRTDGDVLPLSFLRHSPVPFMVGINEEGDGARRTVYIYRGEEEPIAVRGPKARVDADFIVRACNNHDDLFHGVTLARDVLLLASRVGVKAEDFAAAAESTTIRRLSEILKHAGVRR